MWLLWLVVGIIFAIAEIVNSGFFLIWFTVGALASLLVSLITSNVAIQLVVFLVVSFVLLVTLTKYCSTHFGKRDIIPTNIDALIGKTGTVLTAIGENTTEVGQVKLDGEIWSAISLDGSKIEKGAQVTIDEIKGVRLVVHKKIVSYVTSQAPSHTESL